MRIAYLTETYPPELNGVALTVHRTVEYLRQAGHDVDLVRPRQPGEAHVDDLHELRTASLAIPVYRDLRMGFAHRSTLRRRFAASRPDIVHVATQGPLGWAGQRAALSLGLPVTTDFRTNFQQYGRYYGIGWLTGVIEGYLRRFHNRAQATFVPTEELRGALTQRGFENLHVVGRGVDTRRFEPRHRDPATRAEWGVVDTGSGDGAPEMAAASAIAPVILYVGRLAAEKNVPLLLRSFEAVRARQPGAKMVLVGDGPLRASLQVKHREARFLGALRGEALARCYASADMFAFPSMSETFGNVVVEALASGLVVVAFDTAAAGELIADGISGVLAAPDDNEEFVRAVCRTAAMFEDDDQADALRIMREQGRAVAQKTDWESILRRFEMQLESVSDAYKTSSSSRPPLAERPL